MKTAKKRAVGRPRIPGKGKYTLSLKVKNVEQFYKVKTNLSGFVDECLEGLGKETA